MRLESSAIRRCTRRWSRSALPSNGTSCSPPACTQPCDLQYPLSSAYCSRDFPNFPLSVLFAG
ncbi:unnamed protein product [Heligmosomoides polygyrus]|uniref:ShKT domain-containing protein n=1 Tax=Heligmosomoides polygyrus TaxID=6339 RepID=A0A183F7U2_HELPZ|nr:unnamed protein product [Heligmosomoides polygyrus]